MPRTATIAAKEAGGVLHLKTDTGLLRLIVAPEVWDRAQIDLTATIPEGDIEHPQVIAGITWNF